MLYDLVVVGGGPTGVNIAVEARKADLKCIVLEKGMLVNSIFHFPANMTFFSTSKNLEIVETPFISHSDKPTRKEALEYYRRIVESYQLQMKFYEEVLAIVHRGDLFNITTNKNTYQSHNVAIATGFYNVPRMLDVPGEELSKVKHYYDEAHPYVGQNVLVVGAANSACDVALETWQKGAHVTMAVREPDLYEKVKYWILPNIRNRIAEESIKAYFNTQVIAIEPKQVILNTPEGRVKIDNDFVLAMTGYKPDYPLLERLGVPISNDDLKIPLHDEYSLETPIGGMYVAGVLNAGMMTSKLFIENTRHHAKLIVNHILSKKD